MFSSKAEVCAKRGAEKMKIRSLEPLDDETLKITPPEEALRELMEDFAKEDAEKGKEAKPADKPVIVPASAGLEEQVLVFAQGKNIFVIDRDKKVYPITSRTDWVWALCSHNGTLYDGGSYNKVFDTLSNREVASRTGWVLALCSHPRQSFVESGVLKK